MDSSRTAFIVSLAVSAAGALHGTATAGVALGTLVRALPQAGGGTAVEASDPASGPGTYSSDLAGTPFAGRASASLLWSATGVSFTGLADGGTDATVRSQGIAMLVFTEATAVSFTWSMAPAVGAGVEIGWGLVNAEGTGTPDFGVTFNGTTASTFGGAAASADGSVAGTVAAGTYVLAVLAEATAAAGQFGLNATFAPVPGPGALALVVAFGAFGPRRRRR